MTDVSSALGTNAAAQARAIGSVRQRAPAVHFLLRGPCAALFHAAIIVLFFSVGITWPGAIFLSLVLLMAANAAANATLGFHAAVLDDERTLPLSLRLVGTAALTAGVLALFALDGAAAILPVVLGAWCAVRARTVWLFASGAACLAFGLLLLTSVGAQHADPVAFLAVQAASSGAALVAMSLPTLSNRPIAERWNAL